MPRRTAREMEGEGCVPAVPARGDPSAGWVHAARGDAVRRRGAGARDRRGVRRARARRAAGAGPLPARARGPLVRGHARVVAGARAARAARLRGRDRRPDRSARRGRRPRRGGGGRGEAPLHRGEVVPAEAHHGGRGPRLPPARRGRAPGPRALRHRHRSAPLGQDPADVHGRARAGRRAGARPASCARRGRSDHSSIS